MQTAYAGRGRVRAVAQPRPVARADLDLRAFGLQVFALVFLQKFVVPVGGVPVSLPLVSLYLWLGFMVARSRLWISLPRLAVFGALFGVAFIGQLFVDRPISVFSLVEFLVLYLPLMFTLRVPRERMLRMADLFQGAMLIGAAMVFLQLGWQAAFGQGNSPNLENYIPQHYLLQGYNYAAPIAWGRAFVRPNGFFFLEPSFASSFLATALIIELMFFRRTWRILVYGAALLGTVAATGILIMLLAVPFLIGRSNPRVALFTAFAGILAVAAAVGTGAANEISGRVSELSAPGSSGWQRLIAPLLQLQAVYSDTGHVLTGLGAGNSDETNISLWPVVKVMMEYGALAGFLFLAFLTACMGRSVNKPLAFALFMAFNFTGGFLMTAPTVIQIMMLVSLFKLTPQPAGPAADAPPPRRPEPRTIPLPKGFDPWRDPLAAGGAAGPAPPLSAPVMTEREPRPKFPGS